MKAPSKSELPVDEFEIQYARSSGPGGQHVNKTSSKALVRWNLVASTWLAADIKKRFVARYSNRLNQEGELVIASDRFRVQAQNYNDCLEKICALLAAVWFAPKLRKKTKPTRASKERRLVGKRIHSEKKKMRARGGDSD